MQDYIDQIKDSIQITVNPKPQAHIIPKGNPTYVLICPDSGYIYQWIHNGENIIGATNQFYYPGEAGLSSGDYSVIVTNEWGCSTQSSIFCLTNKLLLIYPNPNDGSFTIILSYLENDYPLNFILADVFGNIVLNESISDAPATQRLEYKISGIESGIYIIHIISNNKSLISKKIVVL